MSQDKDKIIALARKALLNDFGVAWQIEALERFAALCRADLVAEVERLDRVADQLIQERDHAENWGTTLATAVSEHFRVPVGEYSNMNDPRREALEILNGGYVTDSDEERERDALKAELARVQAVEPFAWARPDAVDVSQDFRFIKIDDFTVPLYATPPSAVPVVEMLTDALRVVVDEKCEYMLKNHLGNPEIESTTILDRSAIATGQKFIKENCNG